MTRTLTLRTERLTELSTAELAAVAGGQDQGIPTQQYCTGYYPSLNAPCTHTVLDCINTA